jgi:uncharacterized phage protein (TIGR01671 family)
MREIKFRAWVKRGLYPDNMYWFAITWGNFYDGDGWIGMLPIGETSKKQRIQVDPGDVELMQFTGLHDKNGVEIYEGDIVKSQFEPEPFIIQWNSDEYHSGFNVGIGEELEVIGNIYENKELLDTHKSDYNE